MLDSAIDLGMLHTLRVALEQVETEALRYAFALGDLGLPMVVGAVIGGALALALHRLARRPSTLRRRAQRAEWALWGEAR
jgi:hypothetical protein